MASAPSQLARYRPAILIITGFAAALSIHALYSAFISSSPSPSRQSALHRSNALHRPRPTRRGVKGQTRVLAANDVNLLGSFEVWTGPSTSIRREVGPTMLPSLEELGEFFDEVLAATVKARLTRQVIENVLKTCIYFDEPDRLDYIRGIGLHEVLDCIFARDYDGVRGHATTLQNAFVNTDMAPILEAIETFISQDLIWTVDQYQDQDEEVDPGTDIDADDVAVHETNSQDMNEASASDHELKGLLYYIAEEDARQKAYLHRGINCQECKETPIRGIRWHCLNCSDYDVCADCEAHMEHERTHVLAKITIPLPLLSQPTVVMPPWYPGDADITPGKLSATLKKRLCDMHDYEEPSIDALYDQFCSFANVKIDSDVWRVDCGLDRAAFDIAFSNERWRARCLPNVLHDNMFYFYDTNGDDVIDFGEFVDGMAYLRGPRRFESMIRALRGFDMDGDGYVDRNDFHRMLRARYNVDQFLMEDLTDLQAAEITKGATDILISSQAISSIFNFEEIPPGQVRTLQGKQMDESGDMQPLTDAPTILDDDAPWVDQPQPGERSGARRQDARVRLRYHLSRFEEMLYAQDGDVDRLIDDVSQQDVVLNNDDSNDEAMMEGSREAADRDALWQVVQDANDELLDLIFKGKEEEYRVAAMTREERARWWAEIAKAEHEEPWVTTAEDTHHIRPPLVPSVNIELVRTDQDSLARREAEISNSSLTELLTASGYSIAASDDDPNSGEEVDPSAATNDTNVTSSAESAVDSNLHESLSDGDIADMEETIAARVKPRNIDEKPSPARLRTLAFHEQIEAEVVQRGGPGKLSLEELERMIILDSSKRLKGLATCWLELASF